MKQKIDDFFGISKANSTFSRELTGGVTAFLSMAYVIFVNPIILSQAGMPKDAVFMATIISTAIAMFIMGLYTKFLMTEISRGFRQTHLMCTWTTITTTAMSRAVRATT